ncbi:MAG: helix-turn-helix transcriptional regulator [Caulobacteraceae bacterium]|nr:helix-turn-helix transcriptional regulator [Caulobacteraceae bacterium]
MRTDTPNIRAVRAGLGRELAITWKGGAECLVDLGMTIADYALFAPLRRNDALFRAAAIGDWGWSVRWSDEMELSSDTLWRLSLEQGGAWLRAWRVCHGMTQGEAAAALGVSPRMWRYYEAGSHILPKTVRLACIGLDAQARAA